MNPKHAAVPAFMLSACVLMSACTTVDKFTIRDLGNEYGEPATLEERPLVLKEPCKYAAGVDIAGRLAPGPLQPEAMGILVPSNSRVKETIYLLQISDLPVQGIYDIASFIGVRKDGTFVPNVILHSDLPGASPFAYANARLRFTPENCRYSMEEAKDRAE